MIPQRVFTKENADFIGHACAGLRTSIATRAEVEEIKAQCEACEALCLACEDGMLVVTLTPGAIGLEMFVLMAVAFRHGAYERQSPMLDTLARDMGARTIAFRARRRGWARRLGAEWQRRGSAEFVRDVHHVR